MNQICCKVKVALDVQGFKFFRPHIKRRYRRAEQTYPAEEITKDLSHSLKMKTYAPFLHF